MHRETFCSSPKRSRCGLLFALLIALLGAARLHGDVYSGMFVMKASALEPTRLGYYVGPGFFDNQTGHVSDEVVLTELQLKGKPLVTRAGTPSLASGDTVIQLPAGVTFTGDRQPHTVDAQVVAISLESSAPLTITYGGANPELWDVRVCRSEAALPLPNSRITLVNECGTEAGTFVAGLAFKPRFLFTRRGDGAQKVYDPGAIMTLSGKGHWMNHEDSFAGVPLNITQGYLAVPAGAQIDADCNSSFETTLPATSATLLGVKRLGCNLPAPDFPATEPVPIGPHFALEPATRDDGYMTPVYAALPPAGPHRLAAFSLGGLVLLGFAAGVIRPRRPRG